MSLPPSITIEPVGEAGLDELFEYLVDHGTDNGQPGTGYFLPRPREESGLTAEQLVSFRSGLAIPVGELGWRRAWVARNAERRVAGHVDLRSRSERFAGHRCWLGLGVDRDHRRIGLGAALLTYASHWAEANTQLEWFDLLVLAGNEAALRLYRRAGYGTVGEVPEMFRFDGRMLSLVMMSRRLRGNRSGAGSVGG